MAVGKTRNNEEAVSTSKVYTGLANCRVLAVNPNAAKIEELLGYTPKQEPSYTGESSTNDGGTAKYCRIAFVLQTVKEDCGVEIKTIASIFLRDTFVKGSNSGKIHCIDSYRRDGWELPEDLKAKKATIQSNGPVNIDVNTMHAAKAGEIELINFLATYLGLPQADVWNSTEGKMEKNSKIAQEDAICTFDDIKKIIGGDITEITDMIALMPNNKIKLMFGVRFDDNGNMHQDVCMDVFASPNSRSAKAFDRQLESRTYNNRSYSTDSLHEYVVEASNLESTTEDTPFAAADEDDDF